MGLRKGRAVVLRRMAAGEKDLLTEILLDTGERRWLRLHGILASKTRSPVLGEPGTLIQIDFYEGPQSELSLREGSVVERFEALKGDYRKQDFLARILKLGRVLASGEPDRSHFVLIASALDYAARSIVAPGGTGVGDRAPTSDAHGMDAFLIFLVVRVLASMGLLGDPARCAQCERPLDPEGLAAWGDGAFFLCARCSPAADRAGAIAAGLVGRIYTARYRDVRGLLEGQDHDVSQRIKAGLQKAMDHSLPDPPRIFE